MSNEPLEHYRRVAMPLPSTHKVWPLYGAGFENLGVNGQPVEEPLPTCGPDEILVRYDAVSLCTSDLKVIASGPAHPRVFADMRRHPVVLGHEIALTVVSVGARRQGAFRKGDRFVVQPDVFYGGRSLAVGYALPGGLRQYGVLRELLDGDEGCYLLPLAPTLGYAEGALAEPWACVEAAYTIPYRAAAKPGGMAWLVGVPSAASYRLGERLFADGAPRVIVLTGVPPELAAEVREKAAELGARVVETGSLPPERYPEAAAAAGEPFFDDVILLGPHSAASIAAAAALLTRKGALILASAEEYPEPARLDLGRLHYDLILVGGTVGPRIDTAYRPFMRDLQPGGVALLVGGAGPMGFMHVQRALQLGAAAPRRVIVSDLSSERLTALERKLGPLARQNGVDLVCLAGSAPSAEALARLTDGRGVDDIVVLAASAEAAAAAYPCLAPGGMLNLFAGLPRGSEALLDLNPVRDERQVRVVGRSGSTVADLRRVLEKTGAGSLSPVVAVAAVSGLRDAARALQEMAARRFTGKVVVYPQVVDLPLTTLEEMPERLPRVAARLAPGPVWTNEAEEELLREFLPTAR